MLLAAMLVASACRQDMFDRPPKRPLGSSPFFADRSAARPALRDTVPRESVAATPVMSPRRGQERFEIYCAPCHGRDGDGDGVIVRHGFPRPPSFFSPELLEMASDDIVKTIAEGHGKMYSYADRVAERDRWAIAAYIGTLQAERRR
jgi:mono/diheme cytochrome c family protein